jgi:hypothetical protein
VEEVFGLLATIKESTLDVIVFGFPKGAISSLNPEQKVKAIQSQNPSISHLQRVRVLKATMTRRYKAVILGFKTAQAANSTIQQGVFWDAGVLNAEPFTKGIRLGRCFRC